ncbi:MAG: hypothetical protein KJ989_06195 [Gammaproteobacteria bacterium]|nr:hypothetical protein [Gammaproteobacteria bacterium]MBU2157575.1 hypothetical protein [Gammaproteobacteria bacterium]MBU2256385.1 hypothetical protein [Gammaproteobacteria bacterium]MBU2293778.1 hypothetical protein [Gammaproteobacteria bacterium]
MSRFRKLVDSFKRRNANVSDWYQVSFNAFQISISAQPPGKDSWEQSVNWESIIRVLWQGEGGIISDGIYLFTSERSESYVIATDARGGESFVKELINRKYFSSQKFSEAVLQPYGSYCWPENEQTT